MPTAPPFRGGASRVLMLFLLFWGYQWCSNQKCRKSPENSGLRISKRLPFRARFIFENFEKFENGPEDAEKPGASEGLFSNREGPL